MNSVNRRLLGLVVIAAITLIVGNRHASADLVIYSETFGGDGLSNLHGTTPDTTTGANTWTASTDWKNNGAAAATGALGDDNAFLAFTPVAGNIYTLTASLATPSGGLSNSTWGAIGFTDTNTLTNDFWGNGTTPWVLYRENTEVRSFDGPGLSGTSADEGDFLGPVTLSIVLDTTNASDWTAQWLVNGSEVRAAESIGTPTINYVGLGRSDGAGVDFSSYGLTVIPEPSSFAMFAVVGLVAMGRRRKRKHVF